MRTNPNREKLSELAAHETELCAWLKDNKESFCKAIGCWPFDDNMLILALAKLPDFIGGKFAGYKDGLDQAGCDVLSPFLQGQPVDLTELRLCRIFVSSEIQRGR